MQDLNAADEEAAMRIIEGTARRNHGYRWRIILRIFKFDYMV